MISKLKNNKDFISLGEKYEKDVNDENNKGINIGWIIEHGYGSHHCGYFDYDPVVNKYTSLLVYAKRDQSDLYKMKMDVNIFKINEYEDYKDAVECSNNLYYKLNNRKPYIKTRTLYECIDGNFFPVHDEGYHPELDKNQSEVVSKLVLYPDDIADILPSCEIVIAFLCSPFINETLICQPAYSP